MRDDPDDARPHRPIRNPRCSTRELTTKVRRWTPRRVLITRSAAEHPHAARILERCAGGRRTRDRDVGQRPADRAAPGDRARGVRGRQVDDGGGGGAAERAQAAAHPAQCRLADRPGPRLPGALPVLLSGRVAQRAADHPGVRQSRCRAGRDRHPRRPGHGDQQHRRAGARGDDLRAVLLHRSARHRARHRQRGRGGPPGRVGRVRRRRATAVHHQVRRRRRPAAASTISGVPGSGSRSTPWRSRPGSTAGRRRWRVG